MLVVLESTKATVLGIEFFVTVNFYKGTSAEFRNVESKRLEMNLAEKIMGYFYQKNTMYVQNMKYYQK